MIDLHNPNRSCQSLFCRHMVLGLNYRNKHFIFSNGDILSEKINQVDQGPLDEGTACLWKVFKGTNFPS